MARIRTIKPEFFTDDEIGAMPPLHRLAFEGLWCHADREGRLEDRPIRLKVQILPYDDIDMDQVLTDLDRRGFIQRYELGGRRLIQIRTFGKHQCPNVKEPASTIPALCSHSAGMVPASDGHVRKGKEGNGKEGKEIARASDDAALLARFDRLWSVYPRQDAKQEAIQAWRKLNPDDTLTETIIAAVEAQKGWSTWSDPTYVPQAQRWLRRRRWEDEPISAIAPSAPRSRPRMGLSPVCFHDPHCADTPACKRRQLDEFKAEQAAAS